MPRSHAEELIGEDSSDRRSTFSTYNKGLTLPILKAALDKIKLPLDIDKMLDKAQQLAQGSSLTCKAATALETIRLNAQ